MSQENYSPAEDEEYDPYIVSMTDEEGNEQSFEMIDTREYEGSLYAAMIPVYDPEEMLQSDAQLVIMRALEDEEQDLFETIEDDAEFTAVSQLFIDRLSDIFEIQEEDL